MRREELKSYLLIAFVVAELLSMIFNFYFIKIPIGTREYNFNFSVVFFCFGFLIVDIVADQISPTEANKFIYYKLFSQILFLLLGNLAIYVYQLQDTQLAIILNKSPWAIVAGIIATFAGFYAMNQIMSYMKMGIYQGTSVFNRYLCSTLPGELIFSLVFTTLCFYKYNSTEDLVNMFLLSSVAKIVLSILFAMMLSGGENIMWVASQMGHVDTEMVMRTYGKWIPDDSSKKGYQPVNNWDTYMNGRKEK